MNFSDLGRELRRRRVEQGISQQLMADHLAISRATINALETGRAGDVGVKKVMKMADYLGVELCFRDKSPFPTFEELLNEP